MVCGRGCIKGRDRTTSRGLQSLDGEALDKAKQQLKLAAKKGYGTILERFDNDVEYTMHSVSGGYDREFLAIEDILTQSALPNQGRSKEQRYLGVGTYGGGSQQQNTRNEAIARVLYMHECNAAALRAGLISSVSHDPFCIMWLGGYTAEDSARSSGVSCTSCIRGETPRRGEVSQGPGRSGRQATATTELAVATWLASLRPLLIRQQ